MLITRAYVNHGRWVVECQCRSALQMRLGAKEYRCIECGTRYTVLWPAEPERIMRLLGMRVVENQNWMVGEPLDQLIAENLEHGIGQVK